MTDVGSPLEPSRLTPPFDIQHCLILLSPYAAADVDVVAANVSFFFSFFELQQIAKMCAASTSLKVENDRCEEATVRMSSANEIRAAAIAAGGFPTN